MENILLKRLRRISVLALFLPFYVSAQSQQAPMDRNASLINAFQVMCTLELPNFAHLDAKATAMQMKVISDVTFPSPNGGPMRQKRWMGGLTTGLFGLLADELSGPKGTINSCGVFAPVDDADAFRAELIKTMKTAPDVQNVDGTGAPVIVWRDIYGQGTRMVYRTVRKGDKTSISLTLLSMKQP